MELFSIKIRCTFQLVSTQGNLDMAKGDVLRLRYYNGGWNLLEYRT